MKNHKIILILLAFTVMTISGCSRGKASINCPFTELTWDCTTDDMMTAEGMEYDTYDSIYNGTTYTYEKEYLGNTGMVKYMYDDKGSLCNVSWSYTGDDADDVMSVYRAVCDEMNRLHGDGKNDDGIGNFCEMWISDGGTVMANAVVTDDTKVMQIAYMSADVSKQSKQ